MVRRYVPPLCAPVWCTFGCVWCTIMYIWCTIGCVCMVHHLMHMCFGAPGVGVMSAAVCTPSCGLSSSSSSSSVVAAPTAPSGSTFVHEVAPAHTRLHQCVGKNGAPQWVRVYECPTIVCPCMVHLWVRLVHHHVHMVHHRVRMHGAPSYAHVFWGTWCWGVVLVHPLLLLVLCIAILELLERDALWRRTTLGLDNTYLAKYFHCRRVWANLSVEHASLSEDRHFGH